MWNPTLWNSIMSFPATSTLVQFSYKISNFVVCPMPPLCSDTISLYDLNPDSRKIATVIIFVSKSIYLYILEYGIIRQDVSREWCTTIILSENNCKISCNKGIYSLQLPCVGIPRIVCSPQIVTRVHLKLLTSLCRSPPSISSTNTFSKFRQILVKI